MQDGTSAGQPAGTPEPVQPIHCPWWCDRDRWHDPEEFAAGIVTHGAGIAGAYLGEIRRAAPFDDDVTRHPQGHWEVSIRGDQVRSSAITPDATVDLEWDDPMLHGEPVVRRLLPGEALELALALQRAAERLLVMR